MFVLSYSWTKHSRTGITLFMQRISGERPPDVTGYQHSCCCCCLCYCSVLISTFFPQHSPWPWLLRNNSQEVKHHFYLYTHTHIFTTHLYTHITLLMNYGTCCFSRYSCKALLVYKNTTGKLLTDADIMNRLKSTSAASFTLENITANTVGMNHHQIPL